MFKNSIAFWCRIESNRMMNIARVNSAIIYNFTNQNNALSRQKFLITLDRKMRHDHLIRCAQMATIF